jgi:hypothetical protein
MPEGKQHWYFCGKRRWNIRPCLHQRDIPDRDKRCPLDFRNKVIADKSWHDFHWSIIFKLQPRIDGMPTIDGCLIFIKAVLAEMDRHFDVFLSQLPGVFPDQFRPCWKAHLIADCAYKYWYWGTGEQRYIKHLPNDHPFWRFVEDVGKCMLEDEQLNLDY